MTVSDRPLLAVVHGEGSVSPMKLKEAAAAVCDLLWVVDSSELGDPLLVRLLRKLGTTVDIGVQVTASLGELQTAAVLAGARAATFDASAGVVPYSEIAMRETKLAQVQSTIEERTNRIDALEAERTELQARQMRLDQEMLKAEAQIELIKDVILREKAF